ncbi:glycosyl transferase [Sulfuricaulis limicola]|uniref:Glycosyl transferase n=1 Tax=Sulfuricaulis limicola TaxID=1620215 RepID=A0A1B4XGR8_9GAMM|nr:glycosyltransferase family 2 protein [Sulfuricaulis limicola]BAV34011.1 glycosyl transferase [Sulfuricaulis limicola]
MIATISDALAVACITVAAYHYFVYPLAVMIISRLRAINARPVDEEPGITFVIAAYNEAKVIREKIVNTLALDYPREKLEIIVVADGSSDATPAIVAEFADRNVICLFDPERRGKSHALNRAVAASRGEVVVLSDANNEFSRDALRWLVRALSRPSAGGVSGAKRIVENRDRAASMGDSLYWRYESMIKLAESRLGGTVAADGEIFAIRRALYRPIPPEVINDDAFLTMAVVLQGCRVFYEPRATATEEASISIAEDFRVKVRMVAGGYQFLAMHWLALAGTGWFAFKFVSHKILRWLMPLFLIVLLLISVLRSGELPYASLLIAQALFYGLAALGWLVPAACQASRLVYVPFYFTTMNLAAFAGLVKFLRGRQGVLWSKAAR